jgi:gamma-glutamyltranspeptidase/glutathione hydrolase
LDKAIALPNIYFGGGDLLVEDGTPLAAMTGQLSAYGQKAKASDLGSKVNGVQLVGDLWVGAADARAEGTTATVDGKGKIVTKAAQSEADAPTASVH